MKNNNIEDIYTLSPMQQGMLFHVLSSPESRLYHDQMVCSFDGALDSAAFRRAWQQVVARHSSLRTGFVWQGLTKPAQVVHREVAVGLEELDWRSLSAEEQEVQLEVYLYEDRRRGLDLGEPPLMRLALIRRREDSYYFVWSVSHLIVDAWCSAIILEEVMAVYRAHREGRILFLEPSPPYRDFIAWLKRQDQAPARDHWRRVLLGFREPTPLEPRCDDAAGRADRSFRRVTSELSEAATRGLKSLAQWHQLTLNTLVQGAWGLVLAHETDREDVVFGTCVSGRSLDLPGVEAIVGLLMNTLPVRLRCAPSEPLLSWLESLQRDQLAMRCYEQTPLVAIQGWSEVASGLPLFDSVLVFLNVVGAQRPTGGLLVRDFRYIGRTNYSLTLNVMPGERLSIEMVYDVARFRSATIERLASHLTLLLETMVARAQSLLGDLYRLLAKDTSEHREFQKQRRRLSNSGKLRAIQARAVRLSPA